METTSLMSPERKIHTKEPYVDEKLKRNLPSPKETTHRRFSSGPVPSAKSPDSNSRVASSGSFQGLTQRSLRSVAEKAGWKAVGSRLSGHVNGHLPIPQRLPSPQELSILENEPLEVSGSSSPIQKSRKNGCIVPADPTSPSSTCVGCSYPSSANGLGRARKSNHEKTSENHSAPPSLECKEWPMPSPQPSYKKNVRRMGRTRASSMSWTGGGWDPVHVDSPPRAPPIVELEVPTLLKTCLENRKDNSSDNTFVMMIVPENGSHESGEKRNGESNPSKIALRVSCKFEVCEPESIPPDQQATVINALGNGYHILSASDMKHLEEKGKNDVTVKAIPVSAPISNPKKTQSKGSPERIRTTYPFLSRRNSLTSLSSNRLLDSFTSLISSKPKPFVSASGPIPSSHRPSEKSSKHRDREKEKEKDGSHDAQHVPNSPNLDIPPSTQALIVLTCPPSANQPASTPTHGSQFPRNSSISAHTDTSSNLSQNGSSSNSINSDHNSHNNSSNNISELGNSNGNEDASATNHKAYRLPPPPLADTCRPASTKS